MSATRAFKIQATDDTIKRLYEMAAQLGDSITPNGIVAMAAYEISRIRPELLWQALGAIRQMADTQLPAEEPKQLRSARVALLPAKP